ncbi:MAG TPA: chromosomal replication initiator protein DnaA [Alphaproteobacteria bacterium]
MLAPSSFYPAQRVRSFQPGWWSLLQQGWRAKWGDAQYRQWLQDVTPLDYTAPVLTLAVTRPMTADWLRAQSTQSLLASINTFLPDCTTLEFTVRAQDAAPVPAEPDLIATTHFLNDLVEASAAPMVPVAPVLNLEPRYTFDQFVVDRSNELAFAATQRVAQHVAFNDTPLFNPLFLHGGVGLGKTHLLHAVAWAIQQQAPHKKVLYLSAEQFMYRFVRALRDKDMMSFKEQCRSVDVLMIDDVQFIAGKESTQEEFFHTFNALIEQHKQIILSADKSPTHLDGIDARLRSRLGWGLVVDIHPSTYELRLGILQAKAEASNVEVPRALLDYLAQHITSNIREVEGALMRLIAHAELIGRPLSVETAQEVLPDLLQGGRRKITLPHIQQIVATHYGLDVADILSAKRDRRLAQPRQIAMYLAKQLTALSLPDLGRAFGGRDHTTVLHGVRKIEAMRQADKEIAAVVDTLSQTIRYGG